MKLDDINTKFQSYQFMQINPDDYDSSVILNQMLSEVSIVSIHADQSRQ